VTPGVCRSQWGNENAHNILVKKKKECKIVNICERKYSKCQRRKICELCKQDSAGCHYEFLSISSFDFHI
jgi:hypothetical protein